MAVALRRLGSAALPPYALSNDSRFFCWKSLSAHQSALQCVRSFSGAAASPKANGKARVRAAADGAAAAAVEPSRHTPVNPRARMSALMYVTRPAVTPDVVTRTHALMIKAGFIRPLGSGIFTNMPLAVRSLDKISTIINEELQAIGCARLDMPQLVPAVMYTESGRNVTMGAEMFRLNDRKGSKFVLGPTHEEVITSLVATEVMTRRQLPLRLYQIGRKFRDEPRPRHGMLRCREFIMKDLYTFDLTKEDALQTYEEVSAAYHRIFRRMGLPVSQAQASSGAMGGNYSQEFLVEAEIGEDVMLKCEKCGHTCNSEVAPESLKSGGPCSQLDERANRAAKCDKAGQLTPASTLEVGHVFYLGTRYSSVFKARVLDGGPPVMLEMGCYGIGVSRLLAAIVEKNNDNKGIRWPAAVAPYRFCIIPRSPEENELANKVYDALAERVPGARGDTVLDDRHATYRVRLDDAALIGFPDVLTVMEPGPDGEIILEVSEYGRKETAVKLSLDDFCKRVQSKPHER